MFNICYRPVVPRLSLVTDPFQFILELTDPYIFMTNPKQIIGELRSLLQVLAKIEYNIVDRTKITNCSNHNMLHSRITKKVTSKNAGTLAQFNEKSVVVFFAPKH